VRAAAVGITPAIASVGKPRRVVDQQDVQCCVSCALTGALEITNHAWPPLAPLFHYHVTRFDERGADSRGALFLDTALFAVHSHGVCAHAMHDRAFTEQDAVKAPTAAARRDADGRKPAAKFWFRPLSGPSWVASIRDQLRSGNPVVIGFRLPAGYPDRFLDPRHEWTDPSNPAMSSSGHCVLVTGFSDARTALRIHDSQGANRFDGGGWWMGYRVADGGAIGEAYAILKAS
jgi:hypothetical protein